MPPRKDFRQPRETDGSVGGVRDAAAADNQKLDTEEPTTRLTLTRQHPMKKMQAKSHDGHGIPLGLHEKPLLSTSKESLKLNRCNDLLAQSSTETLLDMLKAHAGIKECSEETEKHINGVRALGDRNPESDSK